jgi:uncharacterized repeat protein (TIGR04076 family)
MLKGPKVKVTVDAVTKGRCPFGFKVGDSWLIEDGLTPGGMCPSAYNAVYSAIRVFRLGGSHPWDKDKDVNYVSCPDPKRMLVYEIRRLPP